MVLPENEEKEKSWNFHEIFMKPAHIAVNHQNRLFLPIRWRFHCNFFSLQYGDLFLKNFSLFTFSNDLRFLIHKIITILSSREDPNAKKNPKNKSKQYFFFRRAKANIKTKNLWTRFKRSSDEIRSLCRMKNGTKNIKQIDKTTGGTQLSDRHQIKTRLVNSRKWNTRPQNERQKAKAKAKAKEKTKDKTKGERQGQKARAKG